MTKDEKKGDGNPRGNEWEVVSLTASTYAAAPDPKNLESNNDDTEPSRAEDEYSRALFMSGNFIFPPSQHENLPLEPDLSTACNEPEGQGADSSHESCLDYEKEERNYEHVDENLNTEELPEVDGSLGIRSSGENDRSGFAAVGESTVIPEDDDPSQLNSDSVSVSLQSKDLLKKSRSDVPSEAWWKRRAASLYNHARERNALWSVVAAAAFMGLVILGQRWQQERCQQQLQGQYGLRNENVNRMLAPISRFKDILASHQRRPAIRGSVSAEL